MTKSRVIVPVFLWKPDCENKSTCTNLICENRLYGEKEDPYCILELGKILLAGNKEKAEKSQTEETKRDNDGGMDCES